MCKVSFIHIHHSTPSDLLLQKSQTQAVLANSNSKMIPESGVYNILNPTQTEKNQITHVRGQGL